MKKIFILFSFLCLAVLSLIGQHPQRFDSLYKTIYARELCDLMQKTPGIILLDVRTAGEFNDTSKYNGLNMGHLKGAINIEIDTIQKNIGIVNQYRDKTVVIYCSHSQRSRRVSKLLTENGFTDIFNLNGGMSSLNQMNESQFPCKNNLVASGLGYKNISNTDAVKMIRSQQGLIILDLRPAIQFSSEDTVAENNIGRIRGAINIPYAEIRQRIGELEKYKNSPVLVYASSGDGDGARAAAVLVSNGFIKTYHLLGGLNYLVASQEDPGFLESSIPFIVVDATRAFKLLKNEPGLVIFDTRTKMEFENRDTVGWRNLGNIKNAINVEKEYFGSVDLPANKDAPVLVYGRGEAYKFAGMLASGGYKKVYLMEGLYDFFWSSFNVEECKGARDFLVNHKGIY